MHDLRNSWSLWVNLVERVLSIDIVNLLYVEGEFNVNDSTFATCKRLMTKKKIVATFLEVDRDEDLRYDEL